MGILAMAVFLGTHGYALVTGGSWDRVEGVTVSHQAAADRGELHQGEEVGRIPLYGSAWYRMVAWIPEDAEGYLAAGRILSIASCLLLVAAGYLFLRRRGATSSDALGGASLWLAWGPALQFGGVDRCDAPALLMAAGGWMFSFARGAPLAFAGGALAGLSSAIRPTSGPEALLWAIAAASSGAAPRWRAWISGSVVGGIAALFLFLHLEGSPGWANLRLAGAASADPRQVADLLLRILPQATPLVAVALLSRAPRSLALPVSAALVVGVLSFLRPGASLNWLLGPSFLLSLSLGLTSVRLPRAVLWMLLLQTLGVQAPAVVQRFGEVNLQLARVRAVAVSPLPVLTSETLVCARAGTRIPVEDPHLLESLGREGALTRGLILDSLRAGRWAVLPDPDLLSEDPRYWSRSAVAWVRDSMATCRFDDGVELAFPRGAPCPRVR